MAKEARNTQTIQKKKERKGEREIVEKNKNEWWTERNWDNSLC